MFWWKGNGLWMGLLVALVVVSAGKVLGPAGVPIGLVAAAAILSGMKGVFEDSSLYSIPFKVWPPALIALAALTYFSAR